ncbi:MAG: hypothetical protein M0Z59_03230 [Nitrospiraceae bacterium]|nr:hypothetical protein [Nitrospiraceae bacterium]
MKIRRLYLFAAAFFLFLLLAGTANAGQTYVRVSPPPPYVFSAPPVVVLIPGTYYVYFVPGIEADIFFYHGYWYRPYRGWWFRAHFYNGPWAHIRRPPGVFAGLPPDFRHLPPPGHLRIPYWQLRRDWRTWERDRYWDRHEREEHERGPMERGRGHMGR